MVDVMLKANKDDHVVLFDLQNLLTSELFSVASGSIMNL